MATRFELDEAKAAEWLAASMSQQIETSPGGDIIQLDPDWQTSDDYSGETASGIVAAAQSAGVLTSPEHVSVEYGYEDSEDGGSGYWIVNVNVGAADHLLRLTSGYHRAWKLAEGLRGGVAAHRVLRQAVDFGNWMLDDLDAYAAGTRNPA